MKRRTAFFVSDRTGITAETLGLSLISQFEEVHFTQVTLPFVDSKDKAQEATKRINQAFEVDGARPLIFATIIKQDIREILEQSHAFYIDYFNTFIGQLEHELETPSTKAIGRIHGMRNTNIYNSRIDAVNFALNFDDGAKTSNYETAEIILLGVSRSGKTPTCLYLAMQFGIHAANYPITEEDLDNDGLPKFLIPHRHKLFGLTIEPERLQTIRQGRRPNSRYSDLEQCKREVKAVMKLFHQENIPYLNSTNVSIEELSTKILVISGIERKIR
ncbi:MAG: pyruvate, water dikinase regulatory protein [Candidatus Berkiella sp.]